jgi:hypothetical protein
MIHQVSQYFHEPKILYTTQFGELKIDLPMGRCLILELQTCPIDVTITKGGTITSAAAATSASTSITAATATTTTAFEIFIVNRKFTEIN